MKKSVKKPTLAQLQAWRAALAAHRGDVNLAQLDRWLGRLQAELADRLGVPPVSP